MRFKQIIIIIALIQIFSAISITGFYYMMSPLQNCLRSSPDSSIAKNEFCFEETSW
jgi:hypothetical protein